MAEAVTKKIKQLHLPCIITGICKNCRKNCNGVPIKELCPGYFKHKHNYNRCIAGHTKKTFPVCRGLKIYCRCGKEKQGAFQKMSKSKYSKWFVAQFGKRPSSKSLQELKESFIQASSLQRIAGSEYANTGAWDERFDACLKAYLAGNYEKSKERSK